MHQATVNALPWRDSGIWLTGDTHTHHRLIGGERLLDGASRYCDFIALTSHAHNRDAVEAHPRIINEGRAAHPNLIVVNGVEWNTPTHELAAVLVPGGENGMPVIEGLMEGSDRQVVDLEPSEETFLSGLRSLGEQGSGDLRPAVILQHLHSPEDFPSVQSGAAFEVGPALVGVSAASRRHLMDDGTYISPWASEVGGVLDRLYAGGRRLMMLAESDFHHHMDLDKNMGTEWPGEYMRNCIYCPDRTEAAVFAGLRAGAGYFVIGNIIQDLDWTASSGGRSAMVGEQLGAPEGTPVTVSVRFRENTPLDSVELIGNPGGETRVVASTNGDQLQRSNKLVDWCVALPPSSAPFFIRLHGTARVSGAEPETMQFYANPIWVVPA